MSILFNTKQDYSFLFNSLNSSNSNNSNSLYGINLSDYASIKSGSYGKLLKAYYRKENTESSSSDKTKTSPSLTRTKVDDTVKKELKNVQTYADDVRDSAAALMEKGSKSVFKDSDMEKVYNAVSDLTSDYNTLLEKGKASSSNAVGRYADSMAYAVAGRKDSLNEVGITIGKDNKLSIDKEAFMQAGADKVKALFNGNTSLSALMAAKASEIGNKAYSESNKAALYNSTGNYSSIYTSSFYNGIV